MLRHLRRPPKLARAPRAPLARTTAKRKSPSCAGVRSISPASDRGQHICFSGKIRKTFCRVVLMFKLTWSKKSAMSFGNNYIIRCPFSMVFLFSRCFGISRGIFWTKKWHAAPVPKMLSPSFLRNRTWPRPGKENWLGYSCWMGNGRACC